MKFSRNVIVLSSMLVIAVLSGIMLQVKLSETSTGDKAELQDYQRRMKQIELEDSLCDLDMVKDAHVMRVNSGDIVNSVSIFLEMNETFSEDEIDNISLFVSESLGGLGEEYIDIQYVVS